MRALHTSAEAAQWLRRRVTGTLHCDSRKVGTGDGFIAWPGAAVDGRQFVPDALQHGASACLVERDGVDQFASNGDAVASFAGLKESAASIAAEFFNWPSHDLAVVAVTGTNGKTSTVWWLAQALSVLPEPYTLPCAMVGTLGVGCPPARAPSALEPAQVNPSLLSTGLTTPDPVLLQSTLRQFVSNGMKACAIEASSIGIEEHRLDATLVRVAIFTNLTQDHLDYHGNMSAYWQAKRKLFSWPELAAAVINVDDIQGAQLAESLAQSGLSIWTVSCSQAARLQARGIGYDGSGLYFDVVEGDQAHRMQTRTIGAFNVSNLLGVVAAMRALGVPLHRAVEACGSLQPVPGRMECLGSVGEPLVVIDYAHTPDALLQALVALRPVAARRGGRLWCVFGCGGDRDPSKRPLMGAIASQHADQIVVTSDNPRSEKPEAIVAQILLGLVQSRSVHVQTDRALAIEEAIGQAAGADVVLVAGKGHEAVQEIAGVKLVFSDIDHGLRALRSRLSKPMAGVA